MNEMQIKKTQSHLYRGWVRSNHPEEMVTQACNHPQVDGVSLGSSIWNESISLGSGFSSKHTGNQFISRKEESVKPTNEFVDTENQLIQNRKKEHANFAFFIDRARYSSSGLFNLRRQFFKNLTRNSQLYRQKVSVGQFFNENKHSKANEYILVSQICDIVYPLHLLIVFYVFALSLAFEEVLRKISQICYSVLFIIVDLALFGCSLLKLLSILLSLYLDLQKGRNIFQTIKANVSALIFPTMGFIVSCLICFLCIRNQTKVLPFLSFVISISLLWSLSEQIKKSVLQIISKLNLWRMLKYMQIIMLLINFIIWAHLLAVVLCRLALDNLEMNWMSSYSIFKEENKLSIYLRSLFESINIILSAGFHFPNPTNDNQIHFMIIIRMIAFFISALGLKFIFTRIYPYSKMQTDNFSCNKEVKSYCKDAIKQFTVQELLFHENKKIPVFKIMTASHGIFSGLSHKVFYELARKCSSQIITKGSILSSINRSYDWVILAKGILAVIPPAGRNIYEASFIDSKKLNIPCLLNCSLLNKKLPTHRFMSKTTSKVYRIKDQDFRQAIRLGKFDQELIWSQRDKHPYLSGEFQTVTCLTCSEKHTSFSCPKLHYIPFPEIVIMRSLHQSRRKQNLVLKEEHQIIPRIRSSALKYFSTFLEIAPYIREQLTLHIKKESYSGVNFLKMIPAESIKAMYQKSNNQNKKIEMSHNKLQEDEIWLLKTDKSHDFLYYFPKKNPSRLRNLNLD